MTRKSAPLAGAHWRETIEHLLLPLAGKERFGLISDVDGTLSPIVENPDEARVSPHILKLLADLAEELSLVALVSGRRVEDLSQRVGLPNVVYVGNHGLERWVEGRIETNAEAQAFLPALQAAKEDLLSIEKEEEGVFLEDKGITFSLHYRQNPSPENFVLERRATLETVAARHGLLLSMGRKVFEFKPPVQIDKGSAFRQLVAEAELEAAIYLGDDNTDTAALNAARQLREEGICEAWGIGVQADEESEEVEATADFLAAGVSDVEAFLGWLLKARKASST